MVFSPRRLFSLYLLLVTSFILVTPSQSNADQEKSLKVAVLLGLTGPAAFQSDAVKNGVMLAAEELRNDGWQIDLKLEDDQTNPAKTVSAAQALLAQGYKFFIGPTWSFQINAVRSIFEKHNALTLIPTSSSDVGGGRSDNIFNLCLPRTNQTGVVANWLQTKNLKKALIFTPQGEWGEVHKTVFSEAINKIGAKVIASENFDYGIDAATARSLLLRYKDSGADVMFITGGPGDNAVLLQARNTLKLPLRVLGTADLADAVSLKLLSAEQLDSTVAILSLNTDQEFKEAYRSYYNEDPKLYADRGYEALMLLAQANEAARKGSISVRQYLAEAQFKENDKSKKLFDKNNDSTRGHYEIVDLK